MGRALSGKLSCIRTGLVGTSRVKMGHASLVSYIILSIIYFTSNLKVGSCPNDDNSVQILFGPFLCSISIIL